ncbi:potassium voltage-gated channel subfamily KQT member 1-like [Symsagittifera roscoffensis]|uniref:potassium voltage-gated channel subfamily KQT member 1-like n=1 Tax=Symsagittifera roscoffensis TaxID=84072 RepID=UPI00307C0F7B
MDMELNLMGRRVREGYVKRQSKYNTRYRTLQNSIYAFLERPQGFMSLTYHVTVFVLIFICLLLSVISSAEVERNENNQYYQTSISNFYNQYSAQNGTSSDYSSRRLGSRSSPGAPIDYGTTESVAADVSNFSEEANKALHKLEILLIVIFGVELVLRVWSAGCRSRFQTLLGRLRFIKQPFTFLDIFICVTSLVIIVTGTENNKVFATSSLRGLRFLQILRIVRMDRRGGTWRLLGSVIYLHRQELITTFYIGFLGLIFASLLMYNLENSASAVGILLNGSTAADNMSSGGAEGGSAMPPGPRQFETYADCLWWGIVTLTTVGYGDKVPLTSGGKLVASFFAIMGISFFALPAGILGSGFALKVQEQQRQKHFARRRNPAATLLQCVWRCYAASEDSLSVATWAIHVVSPTYNNSSSFSPTSANTGGTATTHIFGSASNPLARKLAGSNLIERIPSIRTRKNTPTRKASHASTNNGFIMSPTELKKPKSNPQRSSLNLNINNYGNHIETTVTNTNNSFIQMNRDSLAEPKRKSSLLSLNFEAYFPGGFFSSPNSRKNSLVESENDQDEAPRRLTKLRTKHKIAIRFIRRMKYFRARIKFKEALKPYDVKDVIEQYASGHVDLITRVKDIQANFALVVGQKDKKKQDSSFSKLTVASRVVKIENQLTHLERKLDHLIHMYRKDKTQAIHSMHVQHAISSSEDESGTPLSRQQRVPPSQLFVKTRQMDLLSPIISRSRSHSQPNALFLDQDPMHSTGSDFLFQSTPTVSRQASCFLNVPQLTDQQINTKQPDTNHSQS